MAFEVVGRQRFFNPGEIKIGEINSYSLLPAFTEPYRRGWQLAVEEINTAGGINGKKLVVISKDDAGKPIPREIINSFVCTFNGHEVFRADIEPAISANPYFEFTVKVDESGTFAFAWVDDNGTVTTAEQGITVT